MTLGMTREGHDSFFDSLRESERIDEAERQSWRVKGMQIVNDPIYLGGLYFSSSLVLIYFIFVETGKTKESEKLEVIELYIFVVSTILLLCDMLSNIIFVGISIFIKRWGIIIEFILQVLSWSMILSKWTEKTSNLNSQSVIITIYLIRVLKLIDMLHELQEI